MKKLTRSLALALLGLSFASGANAGLIGGIVEGPDSSFTINFDFTNLSILTGDRVTSLYIDGSTALAFPILWDSIGSISGQSATVSGVDTSVVTFNFTSNWDPLESFGLSGVDPDGIPSPASVTVGELEGVTVGATFDTGVMHLYSFVDSLIGDIFGNGLELVFQEEITAVPEPGPLALLGIGLMGLVAGRRFRSKGR